MYYSIIGILALLILLINNIGILKISPHKKISPTNRAYRSFLQCLFLFYIADFTWSGLYSLKFMHLLFAETTIFFIIMALTVYLWTQYVISYLGRNSRFEKILYHTGRGFFVFEIVVVLVNFLRPVLFWFDDGGDYHAGPARYLILIIQILKEFSEVLKIKKELLYARVILEIYKAS